MTDHGVLHLLCGKMAAGKSTLATHLSQREHCVMLSEDSLLSGLYPGEVVDVDSYVKYTDRIKQALGPHISSLLRNGLSVVLDFPANTVPQREWLLSLAKQADAAHELHYLPRSDEQCKARLAQRAIEIPERRATDTPQMFDAMRPYFEPPLDSESLHVIVHR